MEGTIVMHFYHTRAVWAEVKTIQFRSILNNQDICGQEMMKTFQTLCRIYLYLISIDNVLTTAIFYFNSFGQYLPTICHLCV